MASKAVPTERHRCAENVVGGETRIHLLQVQERPDEQSGSNDENKGKSYLAHYKKGSDLGMAKAHAGTVGILVERGDKIRARHGNRGRDKLLSS